MPQKTIKGNAEIAKQIKNRRNELNLTIEEAASRAGIGTKTWCRYEAGESIRIDKCKGICKALNWHGFPNISEVSGEEMSLDEYKNSEAWSQAIADVFGDKAAMAFAVGSDLLLDKIKQDLEELSSKAKGTHLGQLNISFLKDGLPEQFLMLYDYDFLYEMKSTLLLQRRRARDPELIVAHSVLEELIIYLCNEEAKVYFEIMEDESAQEDQWDEWVFDLFDDMDIITFLYSDLYLCESHPFHFLHWSEQQFYMN